MTLDTTALLDQILSELEGLPYLYPEDIPALDLYMDQVTTLMEEKLSSTRRRGQDKLLTKTMINNYTKNRLLPPPEKKKYSREHILILAFIYYFKGILSLQDVQSILGPLSERYFAAKDGPGIQEIYEEIFRTGLPRIAEIRAQVLSYDQENARVVGQIPETDPEGQEFLRSFSLICQLGMDIYIRRRIIEEIIDSRIAPETDPKEKKGKNKE